MAQQEARDVGRRMEATQRAQEELFLRAIRLESSASSAHERAEQLRLGVAAQRSRNIALVEDLRMLAQPMGANTYLRRQLQELQDLQGDLIAQLARHRRANSEIKRASSRQLMEHAGITGHHTGHVVESVPRTSPADQSASHGDGNFKPVATIASHAYRGGVSGGSSGDIGDDEGGQVLPAAYSSRATTVSARHRLHAGHAGSLSQVHASGKTWSR